MTVHWREDLKIGVPEVDAQHREWFAHFASLSEAVEAGEGEDELVRLVVFLDDYTVRHFRAEEKIQEENCYPHLQLHREEHRHFLQELQRLKERIDEGDPDHTAVLLAVRTLSRWLVQHISRTDRELGEYLNSGGRRIQLSPLDAPKR